MSARPWRWSWPRPWRRHSMRRKRSRSTTRVLPGVYHSEDAMRPGAPVGLGRGAGQHSRRYVFGDREATEAAFASADQVVAMDFHVDRVTGVPLEPRAALGQYDASRPVATRFTPAAAARCGRNASLPRCSASRPSGCASFPTMSAAISAPATASSSSLAWCFGRRASSGVRSSSRRRDRNAFLSDYQGRDLVTKVELALSQDGRFLAHARHQYQQCRRALRLAFPALQRAGR